MSIGKMKTVHNIPIRALRINLDSKLRLLQKIHMFRFESLNQQSKVYHVCAHRRVKDDFHCSLTECGLFAGCRGKTKPRLQHTSFACVPPAPLSAPSCA
ncbi:uncharacterized protein PHALS_14662 [Plasmopara halstedii]|uniref:Uncharacterized protein n=1 Tax=Plasmopara halstedii TaxID=4781 RepID=A0A0P1APX2_PLAHL|nr:uncharacterized protein PHALS_14662 [Plasmopara halstedii]CEG42845.1 hypothetical protein PHALS_14662 [Plasmopara halstedii]|eukprot:XP_024579214.1 hypothetical protein PHALS_14662 [Plasmopara halstedii]